MKKYFVLFVLVLFFIVIAGFAFWGNSDPRDKGLLAYGNEFTEFRIENSNVQNAEPMIIYAYSKYLYDSGEKDDAVFCFYLAQFRNNYLKAVMYKDLHINSKIFARFFYETGGVGNLTILYKDDYLKFLTEDKRFQSVDVVYDLANRNNIDKVGTVLGELINPCTEQGIDRQIRAIDAVVAYEKSNPVLVDNLVSHENRLTMSRVESYKEVVRDDLLRFKYYLENNKTEIINEGKQAKVNWHFE